MAKCPKCGTELSAFARFCSSCGNDVGAQPVNTAPAAYGSSLSPAPDGQGRKTGLIVGGGLAALAVIAFLIAGAAGLFSGAKTEATATGVLSAPQTQVVAAPVLNAPAVVAPAAPVLRAPQIAPPPPARTNPMPADVADYLRWLKRFEAGRRTLKSQGDAELLTAFSLASANQLKQVMKSFDENDPGSKPADQTLGGQSIISKTNQTTQKWNIAVSLFRQKNPPVACTSLASTYNQMLGLVVIQQSKVLLAAQTALNSAAASSATETPPDVTKTLQSLMEEAASGNMSREADKSFVDSNSMLDTLRDQYTDVPSDISKQNFDIADQSNVKVPSIPTGIGF